jgi:hypothetical protein
MNNICSNNTFLTIVLTTLVLTTFVLITFVLSKFVTFVLKIILMHYSKRTLGLAMLVFPKFVIEDVYFWLNDFCHYEVYYNAISSSSFCVFSIFLQRSYIIILMTFVLTTFNIMPFVLTIFVVTNYVFSTL